MKPASDKDWGSPESLDDIRQILAVDPKEVLRELILERISSEIR